MLVSFGSFSRARDILSMYLRVARKIARDFSACRFEFAEVRILSTRMAGW